MWSVTLSDPYNWSRTSRLSVQFGGELCILFSPFPGTYFHSSNLWGGSKLLLYHIIEILLSDFKFCVFLLEEFLRWHFFSLMKLVGSWWYWGLSLPNLPCKVVVRIKWGKAGGTMHVTLNPLEAWCDEDVFYRYDISIPGLFLRREQDGMHSCPPSKVEIIWGHPGNCGQVRTWSQILTTFYSNMTF